MYIISVIIPIYNAEAFLNRTFECLRSQTEPDFEVVLVDDGSTDGSAELCKAISQKDSRFRYFYKKNSGVSATRNYGISVSQGKYITFVDADDEFPSEYLSVLRSTIEENECQVAVCDVTVITNGQETNRFSCPEGVLNKKEALDYLLTRKNINSGPCAKIFSRDLVKDEKFPSLNAYEDILFVLKVMEKCNQIAVTSKTEYKYIQNSSGAMSGYISKPSLDIVKATDFIMEFINRNTFLDAKCIYISVSHLLQYALPLVNNDEDYARVFVRQCKQLLRKYLKSIVKCSAFPWKEKLIFILFAFGWSYKNKRIHRF